ncbi:MAG: conserved membrane protein of unknown function [Promethearchaeota archaeon]|nr:MAG: conserved membrane protein of unknown function [Candidatus Lokiarchaeota archaeon]
MKLLPKLTFRALISLLGPTLFVTFTMQFHFILEFVALIKTRLPFYLVIFHYFGLFVGCSFLLKIALRWNATLYLAIMVGLMIGFFIGLLVISIPWFVPLGLFGAGFTIGATLGISINKISPMLGEHKFNGRLIGLGSIFLAFFLIIEGLIDIYSNPWIAVILLSASYLLFVILVFYSKKYHEHPPRPRFKIKSYISMREHLPGLSFAFIWGFFFINTYYSTMLFLESSEVLESLNTFIIIFALSILVFGFPCGLLTDKIGRKFTILLGMTIQALAFILLSFSTQNEFILLFIFPIVIGMGFSLTLMYGLLIMIETSQGSNLLEHFTLLYIFAIPGEICGVILPELLKPYFLNEPGILTIALLFIFILTTIIVFKVKETLPIKSELYIKPESVNEDDLTLFKERRICLVCKGNATGFNAYVCPECGALYCLKCAKVLSNIENMCWVCNFIIDDNKPIVLEDNMLENEVDEDMKKKSKKNKKLKP